MDKRQGIFIVIEGSDGSGKATQLQLIKSRLEAAGHAVETFDFPRYDQPSSYFVKRYLDGTYGNAEEVGPYTSSLFYALDRFEAAPAIRQALSEGKVVVSNRYTGSSMAHQGTKIANTEQRRGFFIWLDNLEFEMLRVPRPDISFVLRVPAEISQALMADRKKDLHESDLVHLQRTVAVYDDLTQLFPKDFQRIDCVRGGQLLNQEIINAMLWEKIQPWLPEPSGKSSAVVAADTAAAPAADPEQNGQKTANRWLTLANASSLLVQRIERATQRAEIAYPDVPTLYVPNNLVPDAKKEYEAKTSAMLGLYAKLAASLAKRGIDAGNVRQTALQVLPVAAAASVRLHADDPNLLWLVHGLLSDELPEAQAAGANLLAQAIRLNPSFLRGMPEPVKKTAPSVVQDITSEFLAQNHIGDQPAVDLTAVWPRNESDLVADMLYIYSSLPLRTIQDRVANWPMSRKLSVLEAYMAEQQPGIALEKAHYSWDLLSPYTVFRQLQTMQSEGLEIQSLTPRYGFDIPQLIEEAGLDETFEKCFDLSLDLFSTLQRAGHHIEAQYAVLHGHVQRWKMTQNAAQTIALLAAPPPNEQARKLISQMRERLAEAHPVIAEASAT